MYSNFGQIGPQITVLVIMRKMVFPLFLVVYLLENYPRYFDDYTCWLSGEQSLPFGLLGFCCDMLILNRLDRHSVRLVTGLSVKDFQSRTNTKQPIRYRSHIMSHVMRKPTFYIWQNIGADQLHGYRASDQRLCFCYIDHRV